MLNPYGMRLRNMRKIANKVAIECTRIHIYIYTYVYIYVYVYMYIHIYFFSMCMEKTKASGHGVYSLILFEMLSGQPLIRYVLKV